MPFTMDASHLYDPARQSPTLQQKQDYAAWDAANPRPWQQVTDPARRLAYEQWLKSPQQEDFEAWNWQQAQPAADQAIYDKNREAWQADRDAAYAANPAQYGMSVMSAARPAALPPANVTGQPSDALTGSPAGSLFAPQAQPSGVVSQAGNAIMGRGGDDEERRKRDRRFIG